MSLLRRNLIANFAGSGWTAFLQIATVPLYLKLLGAEQWGLLAACLSVYAVFALLDLGMSQVLPREVAIRRSSDSNHPNGLRTIGEVLYLFERGYWWFAIIGCIAIVAVAAFVTHRWLPPSGVAPEVVERSLRVLGLHFLVQFPVSCYLSLLSGLQRQQLSNAISAGFSTARHLFALASLWLIDPSVLTYQVVFLIVTVVELAVAARFAWQAAGVPRARSRVGAPPVTSLLPLVGGMSLAVLAGAALQYIDKWFASRLLPLDQFGYYAVASNLGVWVLLFLQPISRAIYPLLAEQRTTPDLLIRSNRRFAIGAALAALPMLLFMAFPEQILRAWTGDPALATAGAGALTAMLAGSTANCFYSVAYANSVAAGRTWFPILVSVGGLIVAAAFMPWSIRTYGAIGATLPWIVVNIAGVVIGWTWLLVTRRIDLGGTVPLVLIAAVASAVFFGR